MLQKIMRICILIAVVAGFLAFVGAIQYFINSNDKRMMNDYKEMVESSFKDNKFTLQEKVVNSSLRYKITVKEDSIVLKYTIAAEKGRQFSKLTMKAVKTENGFNWTCRMDNPIMPSTSCS